MNQDIMMLIGMVRSEIMLAPILFLIFHLIRQFLFIPVGVVCIMGGILFGAVTGTIYSLIGLTLSSLLFYSAFRKWPKLAERLLRMKNKLFGNRQLNTKQITVMRLIPFVHYHLLSLCLAEKKNNLKSYTSASIVTNTPLAFIYTDFGNYIHAFNMLVILLLLIPLTLLINFMREKQTIITWEKFFQHDY
jgi:uncharacterized membrane protein YdjX (TVP38/TMEM64 family)